MILFVIWVPAMEQVLANRGEQWTYIAILVKVLIALEVVYMVSLLWRTKGLLPEYPQLPVCITEGDDQLT